MCNIVKVQDTLEGMLVPDVAAVDLINSFDSNALPDAPADYSTHSEAPRFPKFSFSAGDFNTIYRPHADDAGGGADLWDAVVTCFFMDTAPVVIE